MEQQQGLKGKPGRPPRGRVASPSPARATAAAVEKEREREAAGVRRSSPRVAGAGAGETPPLPLGKPRGRASGKLHESELPAQKPKMEQAKSKKNEPEPTHPPKIEQPSGRGKRKLSTAPSPLGNVGELEQPKEAKEEQSQGKSKLSEPKAPRSSYRTPARHRRPLEPEDDVAVEATKKEKVSRDIDEDEVEDGDNDNGAKEEEAQEEEEEEEENKEEDDKAKDGQGEEEEEADDDGDDEGPNLDEGFYEVEEIQGKRMRKGQCQYLVKWKGWPVSANTWEPTDNLTICSEMIDEFELSRSGKQGRKGKGKRKSSVGLSARKKSRPSSASSLDRHSVDGGFEGQSEGSVSSGDAKQEGSLSKAEAVDGMVSSGTDDEGFAEPNASPKERNGQNTYIKDVAVVDPEVAPEPEPEPVYSQQALIGEDIKNPVSAPMVVNNMPNGSCNAGVKATDSVSEHVQKPLKESISKEEEAVQGLNNQLGKTDAVEEKEPGKRAGDKCAGAKKRKQGCVRRVPQSIESEEPELKHVSQDEHTKELEHVPANSKHANGVDSGSQGVDIEAPSDETKVYDLSALGSPQSTSPLLICEIVKAVSYTNTTTNGKQNVSVVFKARRSDGQEVMVDNQFLRLKFPMLLIDFYEQHLRYSA